MYGNHRNMDSALLFDQLHVLMPNSNKQQQNPLMYPSLDMEMMAMNEYAMHQSHISHSSTPPSHFIPIPSSSPPTTSSSLPSTPRAHSLSPKQYHPYPRQEKTGRWTPEEHKLFLEGLAKFGKVWKDIATIIPSRTVVQIRTHAQKYFQRLEKIQKAPSESGDGKVRKERANTMDGASMHYNNSSPMSSSSTANSHSHSHQSGSLGDRKLQRRASMSDIHMDQNQIRPPCSSQDPSLPVIPSKTHLHRSSSLHHEGIATTHHREFLHKIDEHDIAEMTDKLNELNQELERPYGINELNGIDDMDPFLTVEDMQWFCKMDYDCLKVPIQELDSSRDFTPIPSPSSLKLNMHSPHQSGVNAGEGQKRHPKVFFNADLEDDKDYMLDQAMQSLISSPLISS